MASISSPRSSDDFCLVGTENLFALPIRCRSGQLANDRVAFDQGVEDDYDFISTPGSVKSFDSPSPSPTTYVDDDSETAAQARDESNHPSASCSCGQRMPPFAPCVNCTNTRIRPTLPCIELPPNRSTLSPFQDRNTSNTGYSLFTSPAFSPAHVSGSLARYCVPGETIPGTSTIALPENRLSNTSTLYLDQGSNCDNHASLDRAIMDRLINHAIESHSRAEGQDTSLTDGQLTMKMLVRLLKLPPDHRVSQELIKLKPTLFHPLYREATQRKAVFEKVFTRVEQNALYSIVQAHKCNFRHACIFADCLHSDVNWLSDTTQAELHEAGLLASKVQVQCVNSLSHATTLSLLRVGASSDWQYSVLSALRVRAEVLRQGSPSMRAATNVEVLYARDSAMDYEFPPGAAGFSSIEAMAIAESLNKALPDLEALKQLHGSRLPPLDPSILKTRLKREASEEALSSNGLASPPWKRLSLPNRIRLPEPSAPSFVHVMQQHDTPATQSNRSPHVTPSIIPGYGSRASVTEQHDPVPKTNATDHVVAPWEKPIIDFDGDVESLGLHFKTLQNLKHGNYPCHRTLAEVQRADIQVKLQEHHKICAHDYQQQLMLLEQQNKARLARKRTNELSGCQSRSLTRPEVRSFQNEKSSIEQRRAQTEAEVQPAPNKHPLDGYELQLRLLELQGKKRCALARMEEDPSKKEWARQVIREYDVQATTVREWIELENEQRETKRKEAERKAKDEARRQLFEDKTRPDHSRGQSQTSWQQDWQTHANTLQPYRPRRQEVCWGQKAGDVKFPHNEDESGSNFENGIKDNVSVKPNSSNVRMGRRTKQQQAIEEETPLPTRSVWESRYQREKMLSQAAKQKSESLLKYQEWLMLKEQHDMKCREEEEQSKGHQELAQAILADKEAFEPERRVW